jgi:hypothetical protein
MRLNQSKEAEVDMGYLYRQGGFKNVFKGEYVKGPAKGQPCVHKLFKTGAVFEASFFDNEMMVVQKTIELVDKWNEAQFIDEVIYVVQPSIWVFYPGSEFEGQKVLVEPYLAVYTDLL